MIQPVSMLNRRNEASSGPKNSDEEMFDAKETRNVPLSEQGLQRLKHLTWVSLNNNLIHNHDPPPTTHT
jgi:hypothetical protein